MIAAASTTAFNTAIATSHRIATKIELISVSGTTVILNATTYPEVVVVNAEVTNDRQAKLRRRMSLTLQDNTGALVPTTTSSYLTPFGNTIRLSRGVTYSDGTTDLILLGTFRISEVEIEEEGDSLQIRVSGYDNSRSVSRSKFEVPYYIAAGTNFGTAIQTLISARYPAAQFLPDSFTLDASYATTPALLFPEGNDPWDRALDLAASVGQELWVDNTNRFRLAVQTPPDAVATPNFTYASGPSSTFQRARRVLTDEGVGNKVIIAGESVSGTIPVRGTAQDTDNTSPTFYGGPFGFVPIFQQRGEVTTVLAATTAAEGELAFAVGLHEPLTITAVPDPRIEPGDLALFTRSRLGVSGRYFVVDSVRMPLAADELMEVTMQARRLI